MQGSSDNAASNFIVRAVAFGASSMVAGIGLGIGSFCLCGTLAGAFKDDDLAHVFCSVINVPSTLVGSFAIYVALLSLGTKDNIAAKASKSIFGTSMLLNSLSHWINLRRSNHPERNWCIGMGAFTGILGLKTLSACFKK